MDFARNGTSQLLATVDANCPAGYKAMFADGGMRIATLTPNKGDGQKNWVLRPWTRYVNAGGEELWTTNSVALLGTDAVSFKGLRHRFWGEGPMAITGMKQDWTVLPSTMTCNGWTSSAGRVQFGSPQSTDRQFLAYNGDIDFGCSPVASLYCVEQ